jgi:hypothetical protein
MPTRLASSAACCLAGAAMLAVASPSPAPAAEPVVVAVVAVDGYADLKKQVRWLGTQVGNPALDGFAESFIMMATQFKGLAGLDVSRPAGIVVTVADGVPAVQGCVPVKDLDKLLGALEGVVGPADRDGDVRRLAPPGGMPLDVTERGGWAFFAPRGLPVAVADPDAILDPLLESFTLAVELFPGRMPEELRKQLEAALEQAARAAAAQQGQPVDDEAMQAAFAGLAATDAITFGFRLDPEAGRLVVEQRTVLAADSPVAAAWTAAGGTRATVAAATTSDGKPAAVRGHSVLTIPASARSRGACPRPTVIPSPARCSGSSETWGPRCWTPAASMPAPHSTRAMPTASGHCPTSRSACASRTGRAWSGGSRSGSASPGPCRPA